MKCIICDEVLDIYKKKSYLECPVLTLYMSKFTLISRFSVGIPHVCWLVPVNYSRHEPASTFVGFAPRPPLTQLYPVLYADPTM